MAPEEKVEECVNPNGEDISGQRRASEYRGKTEPWREEIDKGTKEKWRTTWYVARSYKNRMEEKQDDADWQP